MSPNVVTNERAARGHAIVGAHLPLAAGAAFAIKYQGGDQVVLFRDRVVREGVLGEADVQAIEKDVNDVVDEAVAFADASPEPPVGWVLTDIFKEDSRRWV